MCRKKEAISYSHVLTVPQSWQERVLKSEHPTEFGKISKREKQFNKKRTCVEFKTSASCVLLQIVVCCDCHVDGCAGVGA